MVLGCALFLVVFDSLSVAAALPTIGRDLDLQPAQLQWVVNMYSLFIAGLLLVGGRASDLFGHRRMLLVSLVLLLAGTALSGAAQNYPTLLAGRSVQGAASALALPAALGLTGALFPRDPWRSRAFSIMSVAGGTAGIVGAICGGLLTDTWGWHAIFLITIPLNLAAIVAAVRYVPIVATKRTQNRLDIVGGALVTAGLLTLVFGLGRIEQDGLASRTVWAAGAAAVVLLGGFVLWERAAPEPLVHPTLIGSRRLTGSSLGLAAQSSIHTAIVVLGSLHLQEIHHLSAAQTGLALAPALLATSVGSLIAGRFLPRLGSRRIALIGFPVAAFALLMLGLNAGSPVYLLAVLPWLVLQGLFNSADYVALSREAVGDAAEEAADRAADQSIDEAIQEAVQEVVEESDTLDPETATALVAAVEEAVEEAVAETVEVSDDGAVKTGAVSEMTTAVQEAVEQTVAEVEPAIADRVDATTAVTLIDTVEKAAAEAARDNEDEVAHGSAAGVFETSAHVGGAIAVAVLLSLASSGVGYRGAYIGAAIMALTGWLSVFVFIPKERDTSHQARRWSITSGRRRRIVTAAAERQVRRRRFRRRNRSRDRIDSR
jgi:MFS family permease